MRSWLRAEEVEGSVAGLACGQKLCMRNPDGPQAVRTFPGSRSYCTAVLLNCCYRLRPLLLELGMP